MIASFEGHVDIVRTLIEARAQVNTQQEVHCISILHVLATRIHTVLHTVIHSVP